MRDDRKLLLMLQYWAGDRAQAMRVARLIADLEPGLSEAADIFFVARFDCAHDIDTIKYVSPKLHVHHHVSKWRGEGWLYGCNSLWFGGLDWVYTLRLANKMPDYKAVLTFEADSCPLVPGWIQRLSNLWDEANAKVVGAFQSAPGPHMNGASTMFSCDPGFLKRITREIAGCDPNAGWDYALASEFRKLGWRDCPAMRSWWNCKTLPTEQIDALVAQQVVFLHGVKDDSVIEHVRRRFLG